MRAEEDQTYHVSQIQGSIGWVAVADHDNVREGLEDSQLFETETGATYRSTEGSLRVAFGTRGDSTDTVTYKLEEVDEVDPAHAAAREFLEALERDRDFPGEERSFYGEVMRDIGYAAVDQAEESVREGLADQFGLVAADGGEELEYSGEQREMRDVDHSHDDYDAPL